MRKPWFIYSQENVTGPLTDEEVEAGLQSNQWANSDFIWRRGQTDWYHLSQWAKLLATHNQATVTDELWYADIQGRPFGPMTYEELIYWLGNLASYKELKIRSTKETEWKGLAELSHIVSDVGLSRRQHQRVPIKGQVTFTNDDSTFTSDLTTIGIGGFGVQATLEEPFDTAWKIEINSANILSPITARARLRYSNDRESGFEFEGIQWEQQIFIMDHVRRVLEPPGPPTK